MSASDEIRRPTRMRYLATTSLPIAPMIPAAMTHGMCSRARGSNRRRIDSQATPPADTAIAVTITNPARSSARPNPNVNRFDPDRRPRAKAIHSGMAVSASVKLWSVSDSSATEPVNTTTTACKAAVMPRPTSDTFDARTPAAPVSATGTPWS